VVACEQLELGDHQRERQKTSKTFIKGHKKNDFNSMLNVLDKYIKKKRERKQDV